MSIEHKGFVIPVFTAGEIPTWSTDDFSIYKDVFVVWDHDRDSRVLTFIDRLKAPVRKQLAIVSERKGRVWFVWKRYIPDGYASGNIRTCGDQWEIVVSRVEGHDA